MATSFTVTGLYQDRPAKRDTLQADLICLWRSCRLTTRRGCLSCQRGMVHFAAKSLRLCQGKISGKTCVTSITNLHHLRALRADHPQLRRRTSDVRIWSKWLESSPSGCVAIPSNLARDHNESTQQRTAGMHRPAVMQSCDRCS